MILRKQISKSLKKRAADPLPTPPTPSTQTTGRPTAPTKAQPYIPTQADINIINFHVDIYKKINQLAEYLAKSRASIPQKFIPPMETFLSATKPLTDFGTIEQIFNDERLKALRAQGMMVIPKEGIVGMDREMIQKINPRTHR